MVSTTHQYESAIGLPMSPPTWTSLLLPSSSHPSRCWAFAAACGLFSSCGEQTSHCTGTLFLLGLVSLLTVKIITDVYVFISILNLIFQLMSYFFLPVFTFVIWWFSFVLCMNSFLFGVCESVACFFIFGYPGFPVC